MVYGCSRDLMHDNYYISQLSYYDVHAYLTYKSPPNRNLHNFRSSTKEQRMNCSIGFSSDVLLRIPMPIGPFQEPLGSDCYFHLLSYQILASILIIISIFLSGLLILELIEIKNQKSSVVSGLWSSLFVLVTIIVFAACGLFYPTACFSAWVFFSVSVCLFTLLQAKQNAFSMVLMVRNLTKSSIKEILGGHLGVGLLIFLVGSAISAIIIGSIATAYFVKQNDVSLALIFWQVHCSGWVFFVTFMVFYGFIVLGKFEKMVEDISSNVAPQRRSSKTRSDLLNRLRKGKKMTLFVLPMGTAMWVLHCFILPCFWYIAVLQLYNTLFSVAIIWWMFTPTSRKKILLKSVRLDHLIPSSTKINDVNTNPASSDANRIVINHSS